MMMIFSSSIMIMLMSAWTGNLYMMSTLIIPLLLYMLSVSTIMSMINIQFIYFSSILSSHLDFLSLSMVMMSLWLILPILNSMSLSKNKQKSFLSKFFIMFILMVFIFNTFLTNNMLMFYIMFESTILPTIMLILYWGYQPERLNAFLYMTLYTILASLPLILSILPMPNNSMFFMHTPFYMNSPIMYIMSVMAFLVKIPLYSLHMWLPKAHVEAPVEGSMILAGILLKLGLYGIMRFMIINKTFIMNYIIMVMSMVGASITTIICIQQSDMKSLIAYSSVAHMGAGTAALMSSLNISKMSSIFILLAHGFISPLLFYMVNNLYESLKSRSIYLSSGIKSSMPIFSMWLLLALMLNSGVPPSLNFMSEMLCLMAVISLSTSLIMPILIMLLFSMVFSALLYIKLTSMSPMSSSKIMFSKLISLTTPLSLILPTFLMTLFPLNL